LEGAAVQQRESVSISKLLLIDYPNWSVIMSEKTVTQLSVLLDTLTRAIIGFTLYREVDWVEAFGDDRIAIPRINDGYMLTDELGEVKERQDGLDEYLGDADDWAVDQLSLYITGAAYEIIKQDDRYDSNLSQKPEIQFMRHCRNAAFHDGTLLIHGDELAKPAKWNGNEISADMDGDDLMNEHIQAGDLIMLVRDIKEIVQSLE
jgi:hypothetical protein